MFCETMPCVFILGGSKCHNVSGIAGVGYAPPHGLIMQSQGTHFGAGAIA